MCASVNPNRPLLLLTVLNRVSPAITVYPATYDDFSRPAYTCVCVCTLRFINKCRTTSCSCSFWLRVSSATARDFAGHSDRFFQAYNEAGVGEEVIYSTYGELFLRHASFFRRALVKMCKDCFPLVQTLVLFPARGVYDFDR